MNEEAAAAHGRAAAAFARLATAWGEIANTATLEGVRVYARGRARQAIIRSLRHAAHAVYYADPGRYAGEDEGD